MVVHSWLQVFAACFFFCALKLVCIGTEGFWFFLKLILGSVG